jgi:hypothetical protein
MAHPLIKGLPQYVCAGEDMTGERDTDEEPDVPETPPDEPAPVPVQDPPAEPTTPPYVVGRRADR